MGQSFVVKRSSELRATLPIKVGCNVTICFSILGILKNFVMCWCLISAILMPNMCEMLRCCNNTFFKRSDVQNAQLSHPHINLLMGMARKTRYLLRLSKLASVKNLARSPIDDFTSARCVVMS